MSEFDDDDDDDDILCYPHVMNLLSQFQIHNYSYINKLPYIFHCVLQMFSPLAPRKVY